MKTIKVTLEGITGSVRLYLFADEHLGNQFSQIDAVEERIKQCANDPCGYAILNGDLAENITKSAIGNIYNQKMPPMEQIEVITKLFEPIKHKILSITNGNHEERTMRGDGVDIMRLIARQWQIEDRYSPDGAFVFLRFGDEGSQHQHRKMLYTLYISHGRGSGRSIGGKLIGLNDLASIADADIYIHSHTHLPATFKRDYFRTNASTNSVRQVTKLFVNCASNLDYGGYAERGVMPPLSKAMPLIELFDGVKLAKATL